MTKPVQSAIIFAAAAVTAASACTRADPPSRGETVPLLTLARNPEAWRGREVRTCGPSFRGDKARGEWLLSMPHGHHGAGIHVLGCAGAAPKRDSNGCVSGRIARRDGSLEPIPDGEPVTIVSGILSFEWYLHAQCPATHRR